MQSTEIRSRSRNDAVENITIDGFVDRVGRQKEGPQRCSKEIHRRTYAAAFDRITDVRPESNQRAKVDRSQTTHKVFDIIV